MREKASVARVGKANPPISDCIIVGGGVIGLCIARQLAREGLKCTLLDRGTCGSEASWAGAGILAPCNPHRSDPVAVLQERSLALYPDFCAQLLAQTGTDPEYERCGELELLFTNDALRIAQADEREARRRKLGIPTAAPADLETPRLQMLSAQEALRLEPAVSSEILGALQCQATAQIRNPRLLQALKQSCLQLGVVIREQCPVLDWTTQGDQVTGVLLEGESLISGVVVLCAGAWSSSIGTRLHEVMPVHPVRGQMILLHAEQRPFQPIIARGRTYCVPRRDGHVLLGSTEEPLAGFSPRNTAKGLSTLLDMAQRLVPGLAETNVLRTWSGFRPGTPDDLPYLGPVPGLNGLFAATGHFRAGLTLAPATAEVLTAMILNRTVSLDLACCRPGR